MAERVHRQVLVDPALDPRWSKGTSLHATCDPSGLLGGLERLAGACRKGFGNRQAPALVFVEPS